MKVTYTTCAIHSGANALRELRECNLALTELLQSHPRFSSAFLGNTTLGNRLAALRAVIHEMETI